MIRRITFWLLTLALTVFGVSHSSFTVPPGGTAVVERFGSTNRVAEPGLHVKLPFLEREFVYQTLFEVRNAIPGPFEISGCSAKVDLITVIDDARKFQQTENYQSELISLSPRIVATLKKVGNTAENPSMEAQLLIREAFSKERPAGLRIDRALVDLGECGPQPKRIEIRRLPLPAISTAGILGEERVVIPPFWFSTADDAGV